MEHNDSLYIASFLLPPSYMVAPIGNTANKSSFSPMNFSTSNTALNIKTSLPAVSFVNNIGMDIPMGQIPVSNSEVRRRNPVSSVNLSRESSIASSGCSTPYHDRMDTDMDCNSTIEEPSPERLELSYQEKVLWVGMVANHQETTRPLNVHNEAPLTHAPTRMISSTSNFHTTFRPLPNQNYGAVLSTISLHSSIEHFASDSKNIKVTLNFLAKYIQNKQINGSKGNDLNDFNSIEDTIWNFISAVYVARWDTLYTDQKTNTLGSKISLKFTLRTIPTNDNNKKEIVKSVPVTINKALPLPPLLAKSKKEINVISKYFQSKKSTVDNNVQGSNVNSGKSYAQASKTLVNTSEVLKIKEIFPFLNAQKIDQVNNIVNGQNKPKPRIKMTTK